MKIKKSKKDMAPHTRQSLLQTAAGRTVIGNPEEALPTHTEGKCTVNLLQNELETPHTTVRLLREFRQVQQKFTHH